METLPPIKDEVKEYYGKGLDETLAIQLKIRTNAAICRFMIKITKFSGALSCDVEVGNPSSLTVFLVPQPHTNLKS